MKISNKVLAFITLATLVLSFAINAFATHDSYCWYIKRNANKRPIIQKEQTLIYNYDGYFIDKKLTDDSEKKVLYLTFDLGYENGNTAKILNTLKKEKIPAAFFILDNIILKNPDLVTRMENEGHLICNHTKNHKDLTKLSEDQIIKNITDLEKLYEEKTGNTLAKYFRFPEGKYNEKALSIVQKLGYKTIFWSFAYEDWNNKRQPNSKRAIKKILDNTHNGAVILLHPTSETNATILPFVISEWRNMGYTFGTLDELCYE